MPTFAILAYDGIEPIDIGATYGVLSMAKRIAPELAFFVVAKSAGEVVMANGLRLIADNGIDDCPDCNVLMVLGGPGWTVASEDCGTLQFVRRVAAKGAIVASVCTGGMILGAAGLLDGIKATTKAAVFDGETAPLALMSDKIAVQAAVHARVIDEGAIVTGGGVSLGIDMTLHLIKRLCGEAVASETARVLEYQAAWAANAARLPDHIAV